MLINRNILFLTFFLIIISMGSVAAVEDTDLYDSHLGINSNNTLNFTPINNTIQEEENDESEFEFSQDVNASNDKTDCLSGCCSVILHVRDGYDVFAYRRDSSYAANLYFTVTNWYGKTAVKEYKTTQGYFFHTIVTMDGWMVGIGGGDVPSVVYQLERLAGNAAASGKITSSTINTALSLLPKLSGLGHFIIKSPSNVVGYAIYNGGRKSGIFTMGNGQYISVPNSPACYRTGYVSTSDPVTRTMSLAYNNPWGVNHRNVIGFEYIRTSDLFNHITKINVYASKSLRSDNIIYRGKFISGSSLPTTPSKRFLGQVVNKVSRPTTQLGYENIVYTYSGILDSYSTTGNLPGSVGVGPWMITVGDVVDAAKYVKNYVESNYKLPSSVFVGETQVKMPTFLKLVTSSVLQIKNGNSNSLINPKNYGNPPSPRDEINRGNMPLEEYIYIAQNVNRCMDSMGRAPNFAPNTGSGPYITSLGPRFSYQNMIYTYSTILDYYNKTGILPATVDVKPWQIITKYKSTTYTIQETLDAAQWVKNYIEINQKLPPYVTINEKNVNLPSFLKLLTTVIQKISNGDYTSTSLTKIYQSPTAPQDTIRTGQLTKASYLQIAGIIQRYMDHNQKTPNYSTKSGLGRNWGYENMIYTYSKILDSYKSNRVLPNNFAVVPWNSIANYSGKFTIAQTLDAATWFKNYFDNEHKIPDHVNITGTNLKGEVKPGNISLPLFLKLLTTVIQKISNGDYTSTSLTKIYQNPTAPQDTIRTGQLTKASYLQIAGIIQRYMDRNKKTPNYSTKSGLGSYWGFHNMIYTYSKILDSYKQTNQLPSNVAVSMLMRPVSVKQVVTAAVQTKKYIDTNHKLPSWVVVGGNTINMPTFLKLLTSCVVQIYNKDLTSLMKVQIYTDPLKPLDGMRNRQMYKNEYITIANRITRYMANNGRAPDYATALR